MVMVLLDGFLSLFKRYHTVFCCTCCVLYATISSITLFRPFYFPQTPSTCGERCMKELKVQSTDLELFSSATFSKGQKATGEARKRTLSWDVTSCKYSQGTYGYLPRRTKPELVYSQMNPSNKPARKRGRWESNKASMWINICCISYLSSAIQGTIYLKCCALIYVIWEYI